MAGSCTRTAAGSENDYVPVGRRPLLSTLRSGTLLYVWRSNAHVYASECMTTCLLDGVCPWVIWRGIKWEV